MHETRYENELRERLERYDRWMAEKKVSSASKVIPVEQSLETKEWVLPTEQVLDVLSRAKSYALADCICRTKYQRCDNPREVCFLLDEYGDKWVEQGKARRVSLEEAQERAALANEKGLVHLTFNSPKGYIFALCSCCSCCCHDLQIMIRLGRGDVIARSDYVAATDPEACIDCGECVDRCVFEARTLEDDGLRYDPDKCYGCGLCLTVCPTGATEMVIKAEVA